MFRDTITRLFVALAGFLIMYLVYTKVMETRTEFVDIEWHKDINGDAKEGNTLPVIANVSIKNKPECHCKNCFNLLSLYTYQ